MCKIPWFGGDEGFVLVLRKIFFVIEAYWHDAIYFPIGAFRHNHPTPVKIWFTAGGLLMIGLTLGGIFLLPAQLAPYLLFWGQLGSACIYAAIGILIGLPWRRPFMSHVACWAQDLCAVLFVVTLFHH